jgi:hypothetical protein
MTNSPRPDLLLHFIPIPFIYEYNHTYKPKGHTKHIKNNYPAYLRIYQPLFILPENPLQTNHAKIIFNNNSNQYITLELSLYSNYQLKACLSMQILYTFYTRNFV